MRVSIVILVMASAIVQRLPAQQTDAIPRELAVALIDRYGAISDTTGIVVGRLPRSFPSDALPRDDIRILGGIEGDRGATVVVDLPEPPERAVARLAAHLERAGWRRAREGERMGSGFIPSATERPTLFCRDNAFLVYIPRGRQAAAGSRLNISVTVTPRETPSPCTRDGDEGRGRYGFDSRALPSLVSPS